MNPTSGEPEERIMQCMEIRGGNQAVEEAVAMPGLDLWVSSQPHQGAMEGGDVHYISLCGGGLTTRLVVADISGHGESVAEFSTSLRTLMRKHINTKSQIRFVESLNQEFADLAQWRRFATAIVATYLASERSLTVCNAGHPRPLWYRATDREWVFMQTGEMAPGNLPFGIDEHSSYHQFALTLAPGDLVLIYTDALTEASDSSGRLFGEDGLIALARGLEPGNPRTFGRAMLAGVAAHRGGEPFDDDTTLVVLHHNAEGSRRLSVGEKLDVYAKVLRLKSY